MTEDIAFSTPWFRLLARRAEGAGQPYYCIDTFDYVSIVALDEAKRLVLVKQYRPAIQSVAIELPGGHVDPGQEALAAARQELWEETGYRAATWELLGRLRPDVGRLTNHLWCFWAEGLYRPGDETWQTERGVEPTTWAGSLDQLLASGLDNAFSLASVFLAVLKQKLPPGDRREMLC